MTHPDWQWNEIQQVGTDYTDLAEVEAYDKRMGEFRNVDQENCDMLEMLDLPKGSAVLEIGCGTGRFARAACKAGHQITAIDVSPIMLEYVAKKAREEGLSEIKTQHSGFITMDFPDNSFNAVVSGAALHHLPDLWKFVALRNINRLLKPGGQFILRDVVFTVKDQTTPESCFEQFSASFPNMRKEAARHIATEFSTYGWIMEGLLKRAGFNIKSAENYHDSFLVYHCVQVSD